MQIVTIDHLIEECHGRSDVAGWWNLRDGTYVGDLTTELQTYVAATKIALIHSEISEALEGLRKSTMDDHLPHRRTVEVELADAMIRIADLAGFLQLDLTAAINEKLEYNAKRADHKPEARAADGGKVI